MQGLLKVCGSSSRKPGVSQSNSRRWTVFARTAAEICAGRFCRGKHNARGCHDPVAAVLRGFCAAKRSAEDCGGNLQFPDSNNTIVATVSDDLVQKRGVQAGTLVAQLARRVGGGGGGRPTLATAGGRQPENLDAALVEAAEVLGEMLG